MSIKIEDMSKWDEWDVGIPTVNISNIHISTEGINSSKKIKKDPIRITNMYIGVKEIQVRYEIDDWLSDLTGKPEIRQYLFPESVYNLICNGSIITINEEIYDKLIDMINADVV